MSEQKAVTTKEDPIYQMLANYKTAIASVLPKHLTPEKFLRIAYQAIHKVPKLRSCNSLSLINAIIEASILGLEVGRTAHLIPFKDQATLIIDYKGMIELAHRSDKVESTPLKAVYENDLFEYAEGTDRYIKHKPARDKRGKLSAAYAIVNFKGGGYDFEVVLPEDIESVKKRSPGAKKADSPWNTEDEPMMWAKTAMRRLAKRIPQCPELQKAAYLEELVEAGLKQNLAHITNGAIDADFKSVKEEPREPIQKQAITEKLDKLKADGQISKETKLCPNKNDKPVPIADCDLCTVRQGCPAWA
uniref:Putative DNA recombination protein n=1 Tax=viral metagenome TaxID=1070528 RepID=A0A6H2A352_9ZZZZ